MNEYNFQYNQIWGSIQNFSNSEIIYSFDLFVFLNLTTGVIQDNVLKSVSYTCTVDVKWTNCLKKAKKVWIL